jgi:hypothetical protein
MILKIFSSKNLAKKYCWFFDKFGTLHSFLSENRRKTLKLVITTSTFQNIEFRIQASQWHTESKTYMYFFHLTHTSRHTGHLSAKNWYHL